MPVAKGKVSSAKHENANGNIRPTSMQSCSEPSERKVVGNYMLGKTIGEGTFGKVRLGVHIPTGEKVAVKVLEKSRIKEQADVRRVNREIKILKKNRHENIIQLYEVYDTTNSIYLIMENAEGGEMFDFIVAQRRVPELLACNFFHQITDGVEVLHRNEITHRDLKPENLLLKAYGGGWIVKIVDFGLSNTHEGGKFLSTACGSPCYAAPEMVAGKKYFGPLADIWSMGVILFALVCGYLPFEDNNTSILYKKILAGNYTAPNWISAEAKHLIRKILETDPKKRYTVADIRTHPWYKVVNDNDVPKETVTATDNRTIMSDVMAMVKSEGLDLKALEDGLSSNACNSVTATYYLIVKKCRAKLHKQLQPPPQQQGAPNADHKLPAIQNATLTTAAAGTAAAAGAASSKATPITASSKDAPIAAEKTQSVPSAAARPAAVKVASQAITGAVTAPPVGEKPSTESVKTGLAQPAQPSKAPPSFRRPTSATPAVPAAAVVVSANTAAALVPTPNRPQPQPLDAAVSVATGALVKAPFASPSQAEAAAATTHSAKQPGENATSSAPNPVRIPQLKMATAAGMKNSTEILPDTKPESAIQRLYREHQATNADGANSTIKPGIDNTLISQTYRQPNETEDLQVSEHPKSARPVMQSIQEKEIIVQPFEPLPPSDQNILKEDETSAAISTIAQTTKPDTTAAPASTPHTPTEAPRDSSSFRKGRVVL